MGRTGRFPEFDLCRFACILARVEMHSRAQPIMAGCLRRRRTPPDARLAAPRPVAARRPLCRQGRRAAAAALRIRPHPLPGAGRGRVVHRPRRRPASPSCTPFGAAARRLPARARRAASRKPTPRRSRRSSARTNHDVKAVEYWLDERLAGDAELAARDRLHPLRLHLRRHQQHQPRADAARRRAREVLLPALDGLRRDAAPRSRGEHADAADALAHARPDRDARRRSARRSPTSRRGWRGRASGIAAVRAARRR